MLVKVRTVRNTSGFSHLLSLEMDNTLTDALDLIITQLRKHRQTEHLSDNLLCPWQGCDERYAIVIGRLKCTGAG